MPSKSLRYKGIVFQIIVIACLTVCLTWVCVLKYQQNIYALRFYLSNVRHTATRLDKHDDETLFQYVYRPSKHVQILYLVGYKATVTDIKIFLSFRIERVAMKIILLGLLATIVISGCVAEQPIHEIAIPGHGDQVYVFDSDVREALRVPISDANSVKLAFDSSQSVNIVFDGTSQEDNAYFRVVLINMAKIPIFYSYEGRLVSFRYFYYIDSANTTSNASRTWYNESSAIDEPLLQETTLWLKGPHTGATRMAVTVDGKIITIEGASFADLKKAGDRLTLAVFGINSIEDI